jgi:hypothetical protein
MPAGSLITIIEAKQAPRGLTRGLPKPAHTPGLAHKHASQPPPAALPEGTNFGSETQGGALPEHLHGRSHATGDWERLVS